MVDKLTWIDERSVASARLNKDNLLLDYAKISSRRRGAAIATARRAQADSYLDILATEATGQPTTWSRLRGDLLRAFTEGGMGRISSLIRRKLKPVVIAELGNYLLLASSCLLYTSDAADEG